MLPAALNRILCHAVSFLMWQVNSDSWTQEREGHALGTKTLWLHGF